jgi:hypothetical protein
LAAFLADETGFDFGNHSGDLRSFDSYVNHTIRILRVYCNTRPYGSNAIMALSTRRSFKSETARPKLSGA